MNGKESKHGGFSDIGMTMLEVGAKSGDEWLEELHIFRDFLEETEGSAPYIFVWVLLVNAHISHSTNIVFVWKGTHEVVTDGVAGGCQ